MPLVPPYIETLVPYQPGLSADEVRRRYAVDRVIKLASNENPLGPSPIAIEALMKAVGPVNLYPHSGYEFRRIFAEDFELKNDSVSTFSGSEGIMSIIILTFLCDEDEILTSEFTFGGFEVLARSRGVKYRTVPMTNWRYD